MIHSTIHVRYLRDDANSSPDARTVSFTPGDDPVELSPVLRGAAESGAVQLTATPSAWQRGKWCAAFLLTGLAGGAVIVAVINYFIP